MTTNSTSANRTLALVKPDGLTPTKYVNIKSLIALEQFEIVREKKVWLTKDQAEQLLADDADLPQFADHVAYLTSAPCLALELKRDGGAVEPWCRLMGPADVTRAHNEALESIRGSFGQDDIHNTVYGPSTEVQAVRMIDYVFSSEVNALEPFKLDHVTSSSGLRSADEQTLAIIKPDAMAEGHKEAIVHQIEARGYAIVASMEKTLAREEAAQFYVHLKGQMYYDAYVDFMSSGPVYIMTLKGDNVVNGWREIIGPTNPMKAKRDVPMSVRAKFGTMTTRNAVHGSNSENAARRGIEFFFTNPPAFAPTVVEEPEATSDPIESTSTLDDEVPVLAEPMTEEAESAPLSAAPNAEAATDTVAGEFSQAPDAAEAVSDVSLVATGDGETTAGEATAAVTESNDTKELPLAEFEEDPSQPTTEAANEAEAQPADITEDLVASPAKVSLSGLDAEVAIESLPEPSSTVEQLVNVAAEAMPVDESQVEISTGAAGPESTAEPVGSSVVEPETTEPAPTDAEVAAESSTEVEAPQVPGEEIEAPPVSQLEANTYGPDDAVSMAGAPGDSVPEYHSEPESVADTGPVPDSAAGASEAPPVCESSDNAPTAGVIEGAVSSLASAETNLSNSDAQNTDTLPEAGPDDTPAPEDAKTTDGLKSEPEVQPGETKESTIAEVVDSTQSTKPAEEPKPQVTAKPVAGKHGASTPRATASATAARSPGLNGKKRTPIPGVRAAAASSARAAASASTASTTRPAAKTASSVTGRLTSRTTASRSATAVRAKPASSSPATTKPAPTRPTAGASAAARKPIATAKTAPPAAATRTASRRATLDTSATTTRTARPTSTTTAATAARPVKRTTTVGARTAPTSTARSAASSAATSGSTSPAAKRTTGSTLTARSTAPGRTASVSTASKRPIAAKPAVTASTTTRTTTKPRLPAAATASRGRKTPVTSDNAPAAPTRSSTLSRTTAARTTVSTARTRPVPSKPSVAATASPTRKPVARGTGTKAIAGSPAAKARVATKQPTAKASPAPKEPVASVVPEDSQAMEPVVDEKSVQDEGVTLGATDADQVVVKAEPVIIPSTESAESQTLLNGSAALESPQA
ncbi:hypothetical protein H4R34_003440 [Dimargaris verticillata]|uniref:Nucleoside diphosphate kinase n=1 Tax=Dimargaris verticillata TaxID=2761393 RepID=A0A9W8B4J5_9FUNG|nr:hypothetical protein H4R34_003440 [Dimargaris verticillata]